MQPTTPVEHCEWLNKLLIEAWPNYIGPKLSLRFSSIVEVSTTLISFFTYILLCAFCENAYINLVEIFSFLSMFQLNLNIVEYISPVSVVLGG